jgi:hypothetical protein
MPLIKIHGGNGRPVDEDIKELMDDNLEMKKVLRSLLYIISKEHPELIIKHQTYFEIPT